MTDSSELWAPVGYAFGAAVAGAAAVLLLGAILFGVHVSEWAEWEGRLVGVVATVVGAAGAFVGLLASQRANVRHRIP